MRLRGFLPSLCFLAIAGTASAQATYVAVLTGANEVPSVTTPATGTATVVLNAANTQLSITCQFHNLIGTYTASQIHGPAPLGTNAVVKWAFLPPTAPWSLSNANHDGTVTGFVVTGITATDVANLNNGQFYVNVRSTQFAGGEIRGQLGSAPVPTAKTSWGRVKSLYR